MNLFLKYIFLLHLLFLLACSKTDEPNNPTSGTNNPPTQTLTITSISPMSGAIGAKVVIIGTGFSKNNSENTITFGGIAAVVDSASQTRLVTKVPQGAQTGKISVTVNGTSVSSSNNFSVQIPQVVKLGFSESAVNYKFGAILATSAKMAAAFNSGNTEDVIQYGHVWSKLAGPSLKDNKTELGSVPANKTANYTYSSTLSNLEPNTVYYVIPYYTTATGTFYGANFSFQTLPLIMNDKSDLKIKTIIGPLTTTQYALNLNVDSQNRIISLNNGSFFIPDTFGEIKYDSDGNLNSVTKRTKASSSRTGVLEILEFKHSNGSLVSFSQQVFTTENDEQTKILQRKIDYTVQLNSDRRSERWQIKDNEGNASDIKFIYDSQGNYLHADGGRVIKTYSYSLQHMLNSEYTSYDNQPSILANSLSTEAIRIALTIFLPGYFNAFSNNNVKSGFLSYSELFTINYSYSGYNSDNAQVIQFSGLGSGTVKSFSSPNIFKFDLLYR